MTITVRRIRPADWAALRDIRIEAIGESPLAFGSTLEQTRARPRAWWENRTRTTSEGAERALFVAEVDGRWVGLVGGDREPEAPPETVYLISMWVHPDWRGRGVGRRLVDRLLTWARGYGAERVSLWVTENNRTALALYRSYGFRATGESQPLPSAPHLQELHMTLDLGARPSGPAQDRCPL